MDFVSASPGSVFAFVAIVVMVIVALLWAVHRAYRSPKAVAIATLALGVWLGILGGLVASGKMTSLPLNGLPLFFFTEKKRYAAASLRAGGQWNIGVRDVHRDGDPNLFATIMSKARYSPIPKQVRAFGKTGL